TLPSDTALVDGTGTFDATLDTAGEQTITATDSGDNSVSGISNQIDVSAGQVEQYVVSAPSPETAGQQFLFTVTAEDQFGNTALGYGGPLHFTSTDPLANLPQEDALSLTNG